MKQERNSKRKQLDFTQLAARLWLGKYVILACVCVMVLLGMVYIVSSPKEYGASMSMMPEASGGGSSGTAQIALMMGMSVANGTDDAYTPLVYPEILSSIPFLTSLFDVELQTSSSDSTFTLRQIVETRIDTPWWTEIHLPSFSSDESTDGNATVIKGDEEVVDPFHLTPVEMAIVNELRKRIWLTIDKLSGEITMGATMQDPLTAAQLTDTVAARLQEYIIDYRTAKARHDLDYAITINEEAKRQYYEAQQNYADFMDRNQGLALYTAQTTRDRLDNEMKLAFNSYNQTSQQVQQSEQKVQEATPIFAVVNPTTVLLYPSSPAKGRVICICIALGFAIGIIILIYPALFGRRFKRILRSSRRKRGHRRNKRFNRTFNYLKRKLVQTVDVVDDDDTDSAESFKVVNREDTPCYTIDDEPADNTPDEKKQD